VAVYRTQKKVFGQPRTIVVTFNQNLLDGQLRGLTQHLDKARHKLRDLQIQLQRRRQGKVKGGKAPTVESVQKQIDSICSAQFVKKIVQTEVRKIRQGLELTFTPTKSSSTGFAVFSSARPFYLLTMRIGPRNRSCRLTARSTTSRTPSSR